MSIYFDYEVGTTGYRFRRAVDDDKCDIELITFAPYSQALFGDVNIGALIELSALSICMLNEEKMIVGFLALSDHPNVSSVDPADWEYWIRNLYQKYYVSRNTLFVHFMCCTDTVIDIFLKEALISVFLNDCYLSQIVFIVPTFCPEGILFRHGAFKKHNCYKFQPKGKEDRLGNYLITAGRQDFYPKLKMRRAVLSAPSGYCLAAVQLATKSPRAYTVAPDIHVEPVTGMQHKAIENFLPDYDRQPAKKEEDNDDVVEILHRACPRLKELYGLYYISELIGRHPESQRKILVGDIQGRAVSVMCLNTQINYRHLQKTYDLKVFNGLKSFTPLEKEQNKRANSLLTAFGEPILKGQWNPFNDTHKKCPSQRSNLAEKFVSKPKNSHVIPTKSSRVNFKKSTKKKQSLDHIIVKQYDSDDLSDRTINYSLNLSHCTVHSIANMLDDDPFDYDIVNIDQKWLKDIPSCEIRPTFSTTSFKKPTLCKWKKNLTKLTKTRMKSVAILDQKMSGTYHGTGNAFMIELFAFREDIDERYSFDMLEAAFDFMRDYDYCIIRVPTSERYFPLLQHFCFVPLRNRVCCDYALYVAHRSSVLGRLRVREAEIVDIPDIAQLLFPLEAKEIMQTIENIILNGQEHQAFVFTSGLAVVGIGILEPPEEIDFLRCRFNLDVYQLHKYHYRVNGIDAGFANIKAIIVYPVFEPHFRFFIRDLMRLSGNTTLMYVSAYRNKWAIQKGNVLVSSMVPLLPRKTMVDSDTIPELKRIEAMFNAIVPFSAWFLSKKLTTLSRVNITTRIVLIGASRTCLGFLKALLFDQSSTYVTFTSVTLISTYGLPYIRRSKPVAESMFLRYYTSSDKYLKSMSYTYYVNVIQGKIVEINLQEKYLTLTSGNRYHYDLLFLFFGKQYQHPNYMEHLLEKDQDQQNRSVPEYIPMDVPRYSDIELQITSDDTPENVFIINHIHEAQIALNYVKKISWNCDEKIIVYGATVHSCLCINALLTMNVPPESIIFVESFPSQNSKKTRVSEFSNENVDLTIKEVLHNLKITVYRSYNFVSWTLKEMENCITHADFLSHYKYLKLKCSALFYYGKKGIDMRAFIAVHKSGLSYDGGIVIDSECRTRDPSVYAAGSQTRYQRTYYADGHAHKYYDSYEVGYKLGERTRKRLDPLFKESTNDPKNVLRRPSDRIRDVSFCEYQESDFVKPELMALKRPKMKYCLLPGGLRYLEVQSPGLKLPHHYIQSFAYNGFVMETFKKGYFKLHLSKNLYVDGITCLSTDKCSLEKFKYLYGQSATVLKNVHLRFNLNKLDDFYEFFGAPWAFFLYHDQVEDLFAMSKELYPKNQSTGLTVKEALRESLRDSTDASLKSDLKKSSYVEAITEYLIDWLSHNEILLPMYLQPSQCVQFTHDLQSNLAFRVKKDQKDDDKSQ